MRASRIPWALVFFASAVTGAQMSIRPGLYEYTIDMHMGDAKQAGKAVMDAAGFQKNTRRDCITPEETKGSIADVFARGMDMGEQCKMSSVKTVGNRLTFTTTCEEDGTRMTLNTDMTFVGDSFSGTTTSKDQSGKVTTMKMSASRIGECTK
jgi:hypothetical protein